jgi:hypothetical protein
MSFALFLVLYCLAYYVCTSKNSSDDVMSFAFNYLTYFKELGRRVYYIYLGIYHFCGCSFTLDVPKFLLVLLLK